MAFFPPNNALAWSHFHLRGGWTRSLTFTGATMAILAMLIITSARLNPNDGGRTLFGWTTGLLTLQAVCMTLYGSGRVSAAIRQDLQSRMIDSHRLMPLPPMHAVAGYIMGAAGQPIVFAVGVFLIGGLTAGAAGVDLSRWAFANAILLAFSAFVWVVCAYAAFGARLGGAMLFFPLAIPYMSQGGALTLWPGMTVLLSPVIGNSIFDLRTTGIVLPATYAIAFAAQAYFATILFIAASRKYRRAGEVGIDTLLGLCLLAGWVAVTCVGLREWEDFRPRGWSPVSVSETAQIVGSMVAGLLIALPAISANVLERLAWRRHEVLRDPAPLRRPIPIALVIAVAAGLLLLIPFAAPHQAELIKKSLVLRSGACVVMALLGIYFLFELLYRAGRRAGIAVFLWMLLAWGGPIAADLVRYRLGDMGESEFIAGFSTCSPVGALIVLWGGSVIDTTYGLLMQALILCLPGAPWLLGRLRQDSAAAALDNS